VVSERGKEQKCFTYSGSILTEDHTKRVTELTLKLTRAEGMTEEELVHVRHGALCMIWKDGRARQHSAQTRLLIDEEWVAMRKHPTFAFEYFRRLHTYASRLTFHTVSTKNGTGRLSTRAERRANSLAARLFAIIDVWDALRSDRRIVKGGRSRK